MYGSKEADDGDGWQGIGRALPPLKVESSSSILLTSGSALLLHPLIFPCPPPPVEENPHGEPEVPWISIVSHSIC